MPIRRINDHTEVTDFPTEADFLLAASVTYTCTIEGITQTGIPGMAPLTPTLDAEFITAGSLFSLPKMTAIPKKSPSPALLTRAAQQLKPFHTLKILNLGLECLPKYCGILDFDIAPSASIVSNTPLDAHMLFSKGRAAARRYTPQSGTLILGESTPSGTTTACAALKALEYPCDGMFSSSFKAVPECIKSRSIHAALQHLKHSMNNFEKLSVTADNMLLFCAGFLIEASQRYKIILAGGTQMIAVLLIAQTLAPELHLACCHDNITLCTTAWIAEDRNSNIRALLHLLPHPIKAYYSDFHFSHANLSILRQYDGGENKEGVGAGAALAYLFANGFDDKTITYTVEALMKELAS